LIPTQLHTVVKSQLLWHRSGTVYPVTRPLNPSDYLPIDADPSGIPPPSVCSPRDTSWWRTRYRPGRSAAAPRHFESDSWWRGPLDESA